MRRRLFSQDSPLQISLANMVAYALTFVSTLLIARGLGPAGRGETAAALSAFAIAPAILGFGVPLELRRRCAVALDRPAMRAARDWIVAAVGPALVLGLLFTATSFAATSQPLQIAAVAGICAATLSVSWATDTGALMGLGRYRAVSLIRLTHPAANLCLLVIFWFMEYFTPVAVLIASMVSTLVTALVGAGLCRVSLRGARSGRRELLLAGGRYAGGTIAESASSRLDQVLVLPLIGAAAAGQYSIAASLALLPLALGQSLAADHFRAVAGRPASADTRQLVDRALKEALSVVAPVCLVFVLLSGALLPAVFGTAFAEATPVLYWLLPGSIAVTVGYVASMLLAAQGRGVSMTLLQCGGLGLGVCLLLVLGPAWSAVGAGVASSVASVFVLVGQMVVLRVRLRDVAPSIAAFRSGLASLVPRGSRDES